MRLRSTESAYAHLEKLVHELHVIFLEEGILGVHIRKSANSLKSTLCAVAVVVDTLESAAVEHFLSTADSSVELIGNEVDIECCVVRENVHENADIILLC